MIISEACHYTVTIVNVHFYHSPLQSLDADV